MLYNKSSIKEKRKEIHSKTRTRGSSIIMWIFRILLLTILTAAVGCSGLLYGSIAGIFASVPKDFTLKPVSSATIIYDNGGTELQKLSDYASNRIIVDSSRIPDNLKYAFVSIEDERFYEHSGVDFKGIIRALWTDLQSGTASQGASTITQQLIKNNVFDTGGESTLLAKIHRKIQEIYMAVQVEKNTPKDEIMTDYLNTINLGKGCLGVQAASIYYFGKNVEDLTLSECAVLAGITKNPTSLNPVDYASANNERRKLVLDKMYELKYISKEDYQTALADDVYARINTNIDKEKVESVYTYFTDALITTIVDDLQEQKGYTQEQAYNAVYRGGLRISSTQDTRLQALADKIINDKDNYPVETEYSLEYNLQMTGPDGTTYSYNEIDVRDFFRNMKDGKKDYKTLYSSKKKMKKAAHQFRDYLIGKNFTLVSETIHYSLEPQLSFTLIDQATGQVKVLVGGRGKKADDLALNRATAVKRQPGSTFKILSTYAPGIDSGEMTLATVFDDAPFNYENGTKVNNFEKDVHMGLTTVRDAIAESNNIVAVKAITQLTPKIGYDFLLKLGFTSLVEHRVSETGKEESDIQQALALGGITDGVTNMELTAAYAAIANKGNYNKPILYTKVTDANGNVLLSNDPAPIRVMKESTAWLLSDAMKDVIDHGTGEEAKLKSDMAAAGKTGTTSNNYDYWFCGFTPYYTASVWTGYDYFKSFDNNKDYHKTIWKKIMDKIIKEEKEEIKDFDKCKDIEKETICIKSGKKVVGGVCTDDPEKSMAREEYFAAGTVPEETCDAHVKLTMCSATNHVAGKYCPESQLYSRVYRIRPDDSSGKTADSPYTLTFDPDGYICNLHTKQWVEEQKRKEELKKQQEQMQKQMEEQQRLLEEQQQQQLLDQQQNLQEETFTN